MGLRKLTKQDVHPKAGDLIEISSHRYFARACAWQTYRGGRAPIRCFISVHSPCNSLPWLAI